MDRFYVGTTVLNIKKMGNKETIEEALKRVKGIHGDGYYYLAIEGECPDLSELEIYQKVCSLGIKGYYCLMEDKAKDAEDNLDILNNNNNNV